VWLDLATGVANDPIPLLGSAWGATHAYAPVPEPMTLSRLSAGAVVLVLRRRRLFG
jgi:hypothetical protein